MEEALKSTFSPNDWFQLGIFLLTIIGLLVTIFVTFSKVLIKFKDHEMAVKVINTNQDTKILQLISDHRELQQKQLADKKELREQIMQNQQSIKTEFDKSIEKFYAMNREDHQLLFAELKEVSNKLSGLSASYSEFKQKGQ